MEQLSIEEHVKQKLSEHYRDLSLDETLIKNWKDVETYAGFLQINLEQTFDMVCSAIDYSGTQVINEINFPFRDLDIEFSIEVFNKDYEGRFTAFCPELEGCITEGISKMEALINICWAIAETLVLNYDF